MYICLNILYRQSDYFIFLVKREISHEKEHCHGFLLTLKVKGEVSTGIANVDVWRST